MEEQTNNTKTMTKAEKVQANLSAIKLVKALETDNRLADSAEQEILSNGSVAKFSDKSILV